MIFFLYRNTKVITFKIMAENTICAICMDPVEIQNEVQLPCSHSYHLECVKMMHRAKCPQCNAAFGAIEKLGKIGLDEIKKREQLDLEERNKTIADEDAVVAAQLVQQDRMELLNTINQEIAMLQQMLQQNVQPVERPDPTPITEEERADINTAILMFFEMNAHDLGRNDTCAAAHHLVHNMRDTEYIITDCDEIDEMVEIVASAFEFPEENDEPPPLIEANDAQPENKELRLNDDFSSSDEENE